MYLLPRLVTAKSRNSVLLLPHPDKVIRNFIICLHIIGDEAEKRLHMMVAGVFIQFRIANKCEIVDYFKGSAIVEVLRKDDHRSADAEMFKTESCLCEC